MQASTTMYVPAIRKFSAALSAVRVVDEVMPIQELCCFLEVVKRDGDITIMEMSSILGMSESSASRNVANLSYLTPKKQKGLELVESRVDPMDMRKKYVHLTAKGKRLAEQIINILTTAEKG